MSTAPRTGERRPLSVREHAWARAVASWLTRRGASPNGISLTGMLAALLAGAALAATPYLGSWHPLAFLAAAVLIQVRLLANMFDGMVAIESGKSSPLGELFNEIPDRISDGAVLIGAGYALGGQIELGYLAGCLALFIAYLRAEGKVTGAHQEYCGPMAKQQRMMTITAGALLSALVPAGWTVWPGHGVLALALWLIVLGGLVTVVRRLARISAALRRAKA
jgi:phosphatidylglycerophosphate synthase